MYYPFCCARSICFLEIYSLHPAQFFSLCAAPPHLLVPPSPRRNDKFKRFFYFRYCPLEEATHFEILNYDGQVSIVKKEQKSFLYAEA